MFVHATNARKKIYENCDAPDGYQDPERYGKPTAEDGKFLDGHHRGTQHHEPNIRQPPDESEQHQSTTTPDTGDAVTQTHLQSATDSIVPMAQKNCIGARHSDRQRCFSDENW